MGTSSSLSAPLRHKSLASPRQEKRPHKARRQPCSCLQRERQSLQAQCRRPVWLDSSALFKQGDHFCASILDCLFPPLLMALDCQIDWTNPGVVCSKCFSSQLAPTKPASCWAHVLSESSSEVTRGLRGSGIPTILPSSSISWEGCISSFVAPAISTVCSQYAEGNVQGWGQA